jgi:hypothetical protein
VNKIINPPVTATNQTAVSPQKPNQKAASAPPFHPLKTIETTEASTNVISASRFLPIPLDDLKQISGPYHINNQRITITSHQLLGSKLVVNFNYEFFGQGEWSGSAIGILDIASRHCNKTSHITIPRYGMEI